MVREHKRTMKGGYNQLLLLGGATQNSVHTHFDTTDTLWYNRLLSRFGLFAQKKVSVGSKIQWNNKECKYQQSE